MKRKRQIYTRSISRRLKVELAAYDGKTIIMSPYLTSKTAESVIGEADPEQTEVYTLFTANLFASGGSSLNTLKGLVELGYACFHLPKLHAKLVITDSFASIGSQNLTRGGTRNREASYATHDPKEIKKLRNGIEKWLASRRQITKEMIGRLEGRLPELRKRFGTARRAAEEVDAEIWLWLKQIEESEKQAREAREVAAKRRRRQTEERRKRLEVQKQEIQERKSKIEKAVSRAHSSTEISLVDIRRAPYTHLFASDYPRDNLCDWTIGREGEYHRVQLDRRTRVLLLFMEDGRLCYPAINKTRLTQFGQNLFWHRYNSSWARRYKLSINFPWSLDALCSYNVEFELNFYGSCIFTIRATFSVDDFEIVDVESEGETNEIRKLEGVISSDSRELKNLLLEEITDKFKYDKNLFGEKATTFIPYEYHHLWLFLRLRETSDGLQFLTLSTERD